MNEGRVHLFLGNCLDVLKGIPDNSIDVVITDPPYGIDYPYLTYKDTRRNLKRLIDGFIPECFRLAKRTVVFPGVNNLWLYPEASWTLSYTWHSTAKYGMAGYNQWQPILLYGKDVEGFGRVNGVLKSDNIHFTGGEDIGFLSKFRDKGHPCPKPLKVMDRLVRRLSCPDDRVLDPFMGSGTTGVVCVRNGRRFTGIEIDSEYFSISERRIKEESLEESLTRKPMPREQFVVNAGFFPLEPRRKKK